MRELCDEPQDLSPENEQPKVYSIRQDQDGSFHFSRRSFLYVGAAIGGTLLVRGICPRFAARSAPGEALQSGMVPFPGVYLHTAPTIASNIASTLQHDDLVRLVDDRPDLGWAKVATRTGQQGWLQRSLVDFSRATKSTSPDFELGGTPPATPTRTPPPPTLSSQVHRGEGQPEGQSALAQAEGCGEVIQNGDFEYGSVSWIEQSSGYIIRNDWADPYHGSWVAWFGGPDAQETLTQLFHVPPDVENDQSLTLRIKVVTYESGSQVYDTFSVRFLDGSGNPISPHFPIADNTTPMNWALITLNLSGMSGFADQDMQVQFECVTNSTYDTYFVVDLVSFNLACVPAPRYYVYLPVTVAQPIPTATPTVTPSPTACPSYNSCPSHCSSNCPSDCSSDYCSSDCTFNCIYDCTFDCIYDCSFY